MLADGRKFTPVESVEDQRKDEEGQNRSRNEPPNNDNRQRLGGFGADTVRDSRWNQANPGHHRCHNNRPNTGNNPLMNRVVERHSVVQIFLENGDKNNAILNTDSEQGDKANPSRNTKIDVRNEQGRYAANNGEWYIKQDKTGIFYVAKQHEQNKENSQ